jgi:hypothetical protein
MDQDIAADAWTELTWATFQFELTDAIMSRPDGVYQLLKFVQDDKQKTDAARARVPGRCAARTYTELEPHGGPRAKAYFQCQMKIRLPRYTTPASRPAVTGGASYDI